MARATATFRVKLNHLLDSSYLGELQDQAGLSCIDNPVLTVITQWRADILRLESRGCALTHTRPHLGHGCLDYTHAPVYAL